MPDVVRITDVSPRDGLQNEPGVIPTAQKARLIELLCATGVDEVEVTSFVSPKWVPQLGDAAELFSRLKSLAVSENSRPGVHNTPMFSALVPNERGMQSALDVLRTWPGRLGKVSVFTAASEAFSLKNTNASIAETIDRFGPVIAAAHGAGLAVRGYVSCVVACPFEGAVAPARVAEVVRRLASLGIDELDLGDTIGAGSPESITAMLDAVGGVWRVRAGPGTSHADMKTTLHLHDTFGRAPACVEAALASGVRSFDGAVSGLGGCPYASTPHRRAPGNIDTKLLVETIHRAGFTTGVDLARLDEAAAYAREIVAASRAGA